LKLTTSVAIATLLQQGATAMVDDNSLPSYGYTFDDVDRTKAAGKEKQQAHQFTVDIDISMRQHYAANLKALSKTLYPMMYAEATFAGGRYTFCVDEHTTLVSQESNPIYTQLKAIAHIPLAIYAIIFPYADYSTNGQWLEPLRVFLGQVTLVEKNLEALGIAEPAQTASRKIVAQAIDFMNKLIAAKEIDMQKYKDFCEVIGEELITNQTYAAEDQAKVMLGYLIKWKNQVGKDTWDKMYVVCQCIWTASKSSVHEQIIKSTMETAKHKTNVIISEAASTLDDAKLLLARILADRALAANVFKFAPNTDSARNAYFISTEYDLLSDSMQAALLKLREQSVNKQSGCPAGHS
jgi:hypothetical protein